MFYDSLLDLNGDGHIDTLEFAFMDSVINFHDVEEEEIDEVVEELEMASLDYDF